MDNFFRNLFKNTECERNGICSANPILNAVNTVIINEIRQTAFYVVKLKELNFTNKEIMKEAVFALTVNVTDVNFNRNALFYFIENLKNIKNKAKNFYIEKIKEIDFPLEFPLPPNSEEMGKTTYSEIIKTGEKIITKVNAAADSEKIGFLNLITVACKFAALNVSMLKNPEETYFFEILRLLSLTNSIGTRKEKLKRRILEFSEICFEIQSKLNNEFEQTYGKRQSAKTNTNIYKGKGILAAGGDLDELTSLLNSCSKENINVYINASFIPALFYPKFIQNTNFKGLFGTGEPEYDFSKFKGPIYVTRNAFNPLDMAFRGKIFTSKIIPQDKTIKIDKNNLEPLISEAKASEGFLFDTKKDEITLDFDLNKVDRITESREHPNFLVALGDFTGNENFENFTVIHFPYPDEIEGLFYTISKVNSKNLSVYFANCSNKTIEIILCLLNKNLSGIYLEKCSVSSISPHITECLGANFNIKAV